MYQKKNYYLISTDIIDINHRKRVIFLVVGFHSFVNEFHSTNVICEWISFILFEIRRENLFIKLRSRRRKRRRNVETSLYRDQTTLHRVTNCLYRRSFSKNKWPKLVNGQLYVRISLGISWLFQYALRREPWTTFEYIWDQKMWWPINFVI